MSMVKTLGPGAWDFGEPQVAHIKVASSGISGHDLKCLIKRAGHYLSDVIRKLDFAPGEIPLHMIAVGSTEYTGINRNADGFRDQVCKDYHHTFEKYARYFKDHQNRLPERSYGIVKKSIYNPEMHRIELIVAANGTREAADHNKGLIAESTLHKLANNQPVACSMSCVLDPQTPVLTSQGYKPIVDVQVGDLVYTHAGRWRPVTAINRRVYSGEVVRLRFAGLPLPVELTADHLLMGKVLTNRESSYTENTKVAYRQRDVARFASATAAGTDNCSWLHTRHLSQDDRIFVKPVIPPPVTVGLVDRDFAELLGIYLAEGSLSYNDSTPSTVILTTHSRDWAVDAVPKLIHERWPNVTVVLRPKSNSTVSMSLEIHSTELACWMDRLVGTGAKTKRIPIELFNSTKECKLAFLGRWLDGDGFADKKGLHWSSANIGMILQGRDLLLSMGVVASIYRIDHTKSGKPSYVTRKGRQHLIRQGIEYTLNVSNIDAAILQSYSQKVSASKYLQEDKKRAKAGCLYEIAGGYMYLIKEVERRLVENVQTYNIEVAEDESYSLAGMVSHNCKVDHDRCSLCGNCARNRSEYCDEDTCSGGGLKKYAGTVLKGGHVLHADNPRPIFFDISEVDRGADRTAWITGVLEKAAQALLPEPCPSQVLSPVYLGHGERHLTRLAGELADLEARGVSPKLAAAFQLRETLTAPPARPLPNLLTGLARSGIILPPDEWMKLAGSSPEECQACSALLADALPGIYHGLAVPLYVNLDRSVDNELARWVFKQARGHSLLERHLASRLRRACIYGTSASVSLPGFRKLAAPVKPLADLYASYTLAALSVCEKHNGVSPLTRCAVVAQNHCVATHPG